MTDFAGIARIALSHAEVICKELFPIGRRRGKEFVVGNLLGQQGDSLGVNIQDGVWKDFQSGEGGGDIISLIAAAKRISQLDAARWVEGKFGSAPPEPMKPKEEFVPVFPIPLGTPNFSHPRLGHPIGAWVYNSPAGEVINYVCRFEPKEYRALSYGRYNNIIGWHWRQLPSPRPIYNMDKIKSGITTIVIVEGERCASALDDIPEFVVTTWQAGTANVLQADWSPVLSKEIDIILWPDNDSAGQMAMQELAKLLKNKVKSISIVDVSSLPEKYDAANIEEGKRVDFLFNNKKLWNEYEKPISKKERKSVLPFDPLELPGLIGDTIRWINKHAIIKQPDLALYNTIAFAGAVFGRRYCSPIDTRTNIYMIGTAGTGEGKDFSRKSITKLAEAAKLDMFVGAAEIVSNTGLLRDLAENSSQIFMLDEFGMFLANLTNTQAPSYLRSIMKAITSLYSDSNSIYKHGKYADKKIEQIVIHSPNLCIYGTTTEEKYVPALRKSAIDSGELNRFIILPAAKSTDMPERNTPISKMDIDLCDKWMMYSPSNAKSVVQVVSMHNIMPEPQIVSWGECEEIQYRLLCRQTEKVRENSPTKNLWSRVFENTIKIAMIFAIARDGANPVMIKEDFDYAQSIVETSIEYMTDLATGSMAETEHESLHHQIMKEIKANHGSMTRTDILRKFRKLKKRELDDLLGGMVEQEVLSVAKVEAAGGKGRAREMYSVI